MAKSNIKHLINCKEILEEKKAIDNLSKICHRSSMQFRRDFYNATGYSVNEYLRHLRLSNALCMIKASKLPLADIAYSCGYSSQQALCREIKSLLHTTATEYRTSNDYYFLPALSEDIPFLTEISKTVIPPLVCLFFYRPYYRGIENNAIMVFLQNNPQYNGRIFGRDGAQRKKLFCYMLYVEDNGHLNTKGFEKGECYDGYSNIFAQIRVINNEDAINTAWNYLYTEWLPKNMFEYAAIRDTSYESHYFEEYLYKNGHPVRLKLYLPVIRKSNYIKITFETFPSLRFIISDRTGFNAEKQASRDVVEYLAVNYPYVLKGSKEFFYRHNDHICSCGVRIGDKWNISHPLRVLDYIDTTFAILHFNGISDYGRSVDMLMQWLTENNFIIMDEPFAIYDTSDGYDEPKMRLFCPVKNWKMNVCI